MDNIIAAQEVQIERKHFYLEFRENERGRFLRITEEAHGRRNTIIIPATGIDDFANALDEVLNAVPEEHFDPSPPRRPRPELSPGQPHVPPRLKGAAHPAPFVFFRGPRPGRSDCGRERFPGVLPNPIL